MCNSILQNNERVMQIYVYFANCFISFSHNIKQTRSTTRIYDCFRTRNMSNYRAPHPRDTGRPRIYFAGSVGLRTPASPVCIYNRAQTQSYFTPCRSEN